MGKKKSFIDKKNSSTYHVLYRSQRDVGGEEEDGHDGPPGVILWPNPENNPLTNEMVLKPTKSSNKLVNAITENKDLDINDIVEDEYDYERHMKPITGTGDYYSVNSKKRSNDDALKDPRARVFDDADYDDDIKEVDRQLDSIALTADCMDTDIAQALFGEFDQGDFEEILDDFCVTAAEEPEDDENKEEKFDYDAHIQQLIENSNKYNSELGVESKNHEWGRDDQAFFSKLQPLHEEGEYNSDEECLPGIVPALNPEEEKALCEKFALTLAEYDSDELGELDDVRGDRSLEGDKYVQAALDDYLEEKEDDVFVEGTRHLGPRTGGSAFHTHFPKGGEVEPPIKEILAEANAFLSAPEMCVPPEEILIDGQSYFSERVQNPWDVESVLSTYSNLDNNPVTIDSNNRRKKKNKQPVQIQLSNKTGLPLGVLSTAAQSYFDNDDTIASVNKGIKRNKEETPLQKKLRKQQVKQERLMARIQKKMMREAFSEEFAKADTSNDDLAGKSVYRIS